MHQYPIIGRMNNPYINVSYLKGNSRSLHQCLQKKIPLENIETGIVHPSDCMDCLET